ncbi:DNA (cytosine-5-)-methyltransferase [Salinicoccus roseus]|uniref:DNA (cytosine-5-)-methyltransferase n=2 Tax=Salinicoccus roseus TaxID=45670 RepID=A0A265EAF7_9STAP|nr:DNA (cytosine-5-)-methyltransferase [Salinicoccus roseus]
MKKGISLFSSSGIGEYYLKRAKIDIVVANEILPKRASLYKKIYPDSNMVTGDITNSLIFDEIVKSSQKHNIDFLIASPPCQGISIAGKNRKIEEMAKDKRNYLITYVIDIIKILKPSYIIIENVPLLLKMKLHIKNQFLSINEYLQNELSSLYDIESEVLDTADYGTPQHRKRAIIKIKKKNKAWPWPKKFEKQITVRDAIGDLPSIESGERSNIKWHYARKHTENQVLWMKHTPTGKSAFENIHYFPIKENGERVKGYNSSYRRIKWETPAPTITIRSDAISSQRNVHPGTPLDDGIYSDARVLSILELMRLTGLPDNWNIPDDTPELLIRQIIGECIPPLLVEALAKEIKE